jgi:hypothetical protein
MEVKLPMPVKAWGARRELRRERRRADAELLSTRLPSPRLAWRVHELVADDHRVSVARSLADVVHGSDERLLPSASPLNRAAVRVCRPELLALASRVCDLEQQVTARGMLVVERLLRDSAGPLYGVESPERLRDAVEDARRALERLDGAGA